MRKLTAYSIIAISAATLFFSCGKEKISNQQAICKVYVDAPENVTATTAVLKGRFDAAAGTVSEVGFLFDKNADFKDETADCRPATPVTTPFSRSVSDLSPGTEYAYKAYAVVDGDRYLSEKKVFKTKPIATTGITLDKNNVTLNPYLENGELKGITLQLTATVYPENASDKSVKWTSSDKTVATVSDGGLVTVQPVNDYAVIMAENGEFNAQCKVTVSPVKISSVNISGGGDLLLRNGSTMQLTATISPSNAYYKTTEWRKGSDSPSGTTISNNGLVTCTKGGIVTVEFLVDGVKKAGTSIYAIPGPPSAGVDLGNPNGVKWATYNLGTDSQGGNGFSYIRLHKSPNPDVSETGDAATYAWGGKWRRPTHDEMQYLKTNCTWAWTGSGYTVSKSGKSIFLPVKMESSGAWGAAYYWTQTTANSITSYALHLDSSSNTIEVTNVSGSDREDLFIRPVLGQ